MLAKMSIDLQKKFTDEGEKVPVMAPSDTKGEFICNFIAARDLTADQVRQVVWSDGSGGTVLRTAEQQKAWLEQEMSSQNRRNPDIGSKWIIKGANIIIPRATTLTASEAARMLYEVTTPTSCRPPNEH